MLTNRKLMGALVASAIVLLGVISVDAQLEPVAECNVNFMSPPPGVKEKLFDVPNLTVQLELELFQAILLQCTGPEANQYQNYYFGSVGVMLDFNILSNDPLDLSPSGPIEGQIRGLWGIATAPILAAGATISAQSNHVVKAAAVEGTLVGDAVCISSAQGDIECEFQMDVAARMINFQTGLHMGVVEIGFNIGLNKGSIGWDIQPIDGTMHFVPEVSSVIPTEPILPGSGGNFISSYDADNNCELSDTEFFSLLDDWLSGAASDKLFFAGVDAWIGGSSICTRAVSDVVKLSTSIQGLRMESKASLGSVTIYDTSGRVVFAQRNSGAQLLWNLRDTLGEQVANGVYIVRFGVTNEIRKFVVMR